VLTIGVFDGVHRGHQELIGRAVELARARAVPSVLLTFDPHPAEVVRPGNHPAQLTSLQRRAELIEQLGVDVFGVLPFTPELSRMHADEFVHEILVDRLHVAAVVVGENFTFGHRAAGDIQLLRTLGARFGFAAEGFKLISTDSLTYSSTYIRACIDAGDVTAAADALGRPHRLEGIVVRGDQRGRQLGFPTANLSVPRYAAVPADGVYVGRFAYDGLLLPAAVSVGSNPTFSGRERRVEAHVLDEDANSYGESVGLDFIARLRDMARFDSVEQLKVQMHRDVSSTRRMLAPESEPTA
jgi:riboflavin kinase/FMN adenylyltransferase